VDGDTTFLQNSAASSFDGATVTGSAISHTVPNYSQFLGGQASSTQAQGVAYGSAVVAATYATGIWRDVLFLNGTGPLPSAVTFHFTVEGNMTGLSTPYLNSAIGISYQDYFVAQVYAPSTTDFVRGGGTPNTAVFGLNVNSDGSTTPDIRGWDSFTAGPSGGFTGTFSYQAQYDPALGGYGFNVIEGVEALAYYNNYAFVQWNDPLTANFVTNTDGTPLSGFTLSFDSGLTLPSAVPEPSSLIPLGIGAVGLMGYGWRRRKSPTTGMC
jgi:hypothetical protein